MKELGRTFAFVKTETIARNLKILDDFARSTHRSWIGCVPMVKANAYGHGIVEVAKRLQNDPCTVALGVASIDEAIGLRHQGVRKAKIWVFSDCSPWNANMADICLKFGLTPVLHFESDLERFLSSKKTKNLGFHLKFNTGMNRFGFSSSSIEKIRGLLLKADRSLEGICTHFAMAEDANAKITINQAKEFAWVMKILSSFRPRYIHSCNTPGLKVAAQLGLTEFCNVGRPGIGIYGYGSDLGVQPALSWKARVIEYRRLRVGDKIGYGATYRVSKPMHMAILGAGYGDGLKRNLSNQALLVAEAHGKLKMRKILGRVSMDTAVVEMKIDPQKYLRHHWITLLGASSKQAEVMAQGAGTIVYEILTSLSVRVPRIYESH